MTTRPLFALFCLATFAVAEAPPSVITIKAQFIEADAKTGKGDVLSAPTVATRHGQTATITVGNEVMLAPHGDVKALSQGIVTGIELTVTPQARVNDIVLVGRATVREPDGRSPDGTALMFKTREVLFATAVADGEQKEIKLEPLGGRALTVRLTASKMEMKNAAVTYWQAFAALPKLDDAQRKLPADTSAEARTLVEKAKGALDLLLKAAGDDYCTWDLDLKQGPELKLPHIPPAQTLARLAVMRARIRAADGDQAGALDDLLAALRLASDVSRPALLICRLVGISIETPTLNALAAQLPALDEAQRARVASSLGLLDGVPTMAECVGVEEETFGGWMESQLEARAKSEGAKFDAAKWVGDLLAPMTSDGKRVDGGPIRTAEEARKLIAGYRARMKELAKLCELPSAQFQPESAKFFAQLKERSADNVLASMVIPAIDKARARAEAARVRLALLRAALDVQAKGEAVLPGKLATYRKTEGGFELTSVEQFDGKPVVLTVGR